MKINKLNLLNYIDSFELNEFQQETCYLAINNYFELSKKKTLGARTNLAFIALIIARNINYETREKVTYNLSFNERSTLQYVDFFALDKHTSFGNKTYDFWVKNGAPVFPELDYEDLYIDGDKKYNY